MFLTHMPKIVSYYFKILHFPAIINGEFMELTSRKEQKKRRPQPPPKNKTNVYFFPVYVFYSFIEISLPFST